MRKRLSSFIFSIILGSIIVNCANRGTPTGGEIDVTPPEIERSVPENYSVNFNTNEIKIYFNEYIKINDLQKQLIISPPMNNTPEVKPLGGASKYITIKIFDTLQPNTTYAINFGESIVDNNEENPYPYYKYVFSTGTHIDSLSVKGSITDALLENPDEFVSVMLHEIDSTFTDSITYKQKPKYITNTLDSTTTFSIDNIKPGKYLLTALKESNNNYTFQPKTDKIGFINDVISIPADTSKLFEIKLFSEVLEFKATRPSHISKRKIAFGYEGNADSLKFKILSKTPQDFDYRVIQEIDKDTLLYWFKPEIEADSLLFEVINKNYKDTLTVNLRNRDKDSLTFTQTSDRVLRLSDDFKLRANIPIENVDDSMVTIMDKDSLIIPHTSTFDASNNETRFTFSKVEDNRYNIQMLPGTFLDFYNTKNDTLNYTVSTRPLTEYGDIRVILRNATYPVIVQLTNENGEVKYEQYKTEEGFIDFIQLSPGMYNLRVIFDSNKNGAYDTGNYLLKRQPERVSHYGGAIELKAYFEQQVEFTLLK